METINFANLDDYENFAKRRLNKNVFEHLRGQERPAEHTTDFHSIKLKLRGMMNMSQYKGLQTHVLGQKTGSPIMIGPLPPIQDVKLVTSPNANHGELI